MLSFDIPGGRFDWDCQTDPNLWVLGDSDQREQSIAACMEAARQRGWDVLEATKPRTIRYVHQWKTVRNGGAPLLLVVNNMADLIRKDRTIIPMLTSIAHEPHKHMHVLAAATADNPTLFHTLMQADQGEVWVDGFARLILQNPHTVYEPSHGNAPRFIIQPNVLETLS